MPDKLVVQYRGDLGRQPSHFANSSVDGVTDDTAGATFCTALAAHTNANISKRVFLTTTSMTGGKPGTGVNIDRKAIIYFRHPTTLRTHNFTINGIIDADCESIEGSDGERVTAAAMTTLVGLIETATGIAYIPLYGVVIQPR